MAEPQAAMDDFLHGGQISDMTEEINILKKKMRELEAASTGSTDDLVHVDSTAVTIAGVVETNVLAHSMTIDSNDVIDATIEAALTDTPTGGIVTVRVYADAVLIATAISAGFRGDNTENTYALRIQVIGTGANAQRTLINCYGNTHAPGPYLFRMMLADNDTSAIDWTTAKTLNVTVQLNNGAINFRKYAAWIRSMSV